MDRDPHWFGSLPESGSAFALKPMRIENTGKNSGTCALAPAQKGVANLHNCIYLCIDNLLIAGEGGSPQYEVDVTLGPLHAVREGNTPDLLLKEIERP